MTSFGTTLRCESCGKEWEMTELSELRAKEGETEFSHIPDWYEWERKNVRAEVERGEYCFRCKARVVGFAAEGAALQHPVFCGIPEDLRKKEQGGKGKGYRRRKDHSAARMAGDRAQ